MTSPPPPSRSSHRRWRRSWPSHSEGRSSLPGRRRVLTEESAAPGEGVAQKLPGSLVFTQFPSEGAEVDGCAKGVEVVLAEDSPAAGESVVHELPAVPIIAELQQG